MLQSSAHVHVCVTAKPKCTQTGAGIDADILIKVTSLAKDDAECSGGVRASATSNKWLQQDSRPVYGYIVWCQLDPTDFEGDLNTATHEVLHVLVRAIHSKVLASKHHQQY